MNNKEDYEYYNYLYSRMEIFDYRNITQLKHLSDEELISEIVSSFNDFYRGKNYVPRRFNPYGKIRFNKNDFKGQSRELLWSNYREFRKITYKYDDYCHSVPEQDHIETQEDQTSENLAEGTLENLFGILLFPAIGIAISYYLMWGNAFGVGGGAIMALFCGIGSISCFGNWEREEKSEEKKKRDRGTGLSFLFLFLIFSVTVIVSHSKICDSSKYDKATICVGVEFY